MDFPTGTRVHFVIFHVFLAWGSFFSFSFSLTDKSVTRSEVIKLIYKTIRVLFKESLKVCRRYI